MSRELIDYVAKSTKKYTIYMDNKFSENLTNNIAE